MIIAIDIDEVLAELLNDYLKYHNQKHGANLKRQDFKKFFDAEVFNLTPAELISDLEEFVAAGGDKKFKTVEGSIDGVKKLRKNYQLVAITGRPAIQEKSTKEWLEKNFPGCFHKIFFVRKEFLGEAVKTKSQFCNEVGAKILIDDEIYNSAGCSENGINVLLFDNPWNQLEIMPANMTRVYSWEDIIKKLI